MDPLQRLAAPKKHPLQLPAKTQKNQSKPIKQTKIVEQVKIAEEEKVEKSQSNTLILQKHEKSELVVQEKRQNTFPIEAPVQQKTVQPSEIVKKATKQVPAQDIPKKEKAEDKEDITQNTNTKENSNVKVEEAKPSLKDIFPHPPKSKNPLIRPESTMKLEPVTNPLSTKQQQKIQQRIKEAKIEQKASSSLTRQEPKIQKPMSKTNLPQIGEKTSKKEVKKHSVRVEVIGYSQRGSGLLKSTYYHIKGEDEHGSFAVHRKYQEFEALNGILHERWPGCFLPGLSKHTEGKKEEDKERQLRANLSSFLLGLSYSSHLFYRQEVQLFLRSPDLNAEEMFSEMPALKTRDVISRLRSSFGELLDQPATPVHAARMTSFITALRKIISNLGTLASRALALSEAYEGYWQSLAHFTKVQRAYEHLWASERGTGGGVAREGEHRLQRLQQLTPQNPFLRLHSFFSNQSRDAQAFLEVIIASELFVLRKEDLEREIKEIQAEIEGLMLGRPSLRTMASRKPKEEIQAELQTKQKRLSEERETMIEMFSILQILLATRSIPQFQAYKRDTYTLILEQWASLTTHAIPQLQALWQFVADQTKVHK